ncbi:hypothetical protein V496_01686 [Pseudogymnoascus sp. VKM F-4515 (FW-2607)]|nr:hypothetical protein V496_01686 [Pseudogymnoascus sp. VKM F-4515 (FW-2607)]
MQPSSLRALATVAKRVAATVASTVASTVDATADTTAAVTAIRTITRTINQDHRDICAETYHAKQIQTLLVRRRSCDAQTVLLTANISAATWFLGIRQDLSDSFRKYAVGFANSYRRKKFKCMLLKVFAGEEWEQKVLKALRFDLIILCCLVLGPDQFEMVKRHGLQGVFAEQVNNDFEERSPHIPDWIANASKTIARDSSLSKNAAAKTLEQALESPLPNSQLFLEFVEEVVEEVLECHAHDSHLESTQNSEQARVTSPNSTTPASAALPPKPPPHSQTEGSYHGIVMPPTSQYNDTSWAARMGTIRSGLVKRKGGTLVERKGGNGTRNPAQQVKIKMQHQHHNKYTGIKHTEHQC